MFFVVFAGNMVKRSLKDTIKCYEDSKFYRNPERPTHKMWSNTECSKYYLCLDGEVFEFKCSVGLLFDVMRQICDFKQNVDNCDVTAGLIQVFFAIQYFFIFFFICFRLLYSNCNLFIDGVNHSIIIYFYFGFIHTF